jgi:dihydroorotase
LYKCGWSPLEGTLFQTEIKQTFVNGNLVYDNGLWNEENKGVAIDFAKE